MQKAICAAPPFVPAALPELLLVLQEKLQDTGSPAAAWDVVEQYFKCFGLADLRQELWRLLCATLTHPEMPRLQDAAERSNLIFFYEYTLLFIDAVQQLALQNNRYREQSSNIESQGVDK